MFYPLRENAAASPGKQQLKEAFYGGKMSGLNSNNDLSAIRGAPQTDGASQGLPLQGSVDMVASSPLGAGPLKSRLIDQSFQFDVIQEEDLQNVRDGFGNNE